MNKTPKDKKTGLPKKYLPSSLTPLDRKKQLKSILEKKERPKVESFKSERSTWVKKFENKYKTKITNYDFISKNILKRVGINKILDKGRGAYFSSGSRPNQTAESWAIARLASVIMGGPSRKIDADIWSKYKI